MGAVAGGGGSIGAVAVMPSTNGSTVADSVVASLRFDGAVLQMPTVMLVPIGASAAPALAGAPVRSLAVQQSPSKPSSAVWGIAQVWLPSPAVHRCQ